MFELCFVFRLFAYFVNTCRVPQDVFFFVSCRKAPSEKKHNMLLSHRKFKLSGCCRVEYSFSVFFFTVSSCAVVMFVVSTHLTIIVFLRSYVYLFCFCNISVVILCKFILTFFPTRGQVVVSSAATTNEVIRMLLGFFVAA